MMDWVRGVFAASLLSGMAMVLCPRGRVKNVVRLVCGLVCALAIASPLLTLDMRSISVGLAKYREQARVLQEGEEEEEKMLERTYIEEQCGAYILDKAQECGAVLDGAAVLARWDDEALLWYPWSAALDGEFSAALSRRIEADLGVPASRQQWRDHDGNE